MSATVMRWFGNGQSALSDSAQAGAAAVRAALAGRRPALLMVFASMPYATQEMISAAHAEAGGDVPLIGCSTSGEYGPAGRGQGVLAIATCIFAAPVATPPWPAIRPPSWGSRP